MKVVPFAFATTIVVFGLMPLAFCDGTFDHDKNHSGSTTTDSQLKLGAVDDELATMEENLTKLLDRSSEKKEVGGNGRQISFLSDSFHLVHEMEDFANEVDRIKDMINLFEEGDHPEYLKSPLRQIKSKLLHAEELAAQVLVDLNESLLKKEGKDGVLSTATASATSTRDLQAVVVQEEMGDNHTDSQDTTDREFEEEEGDGNDGVENHDEEQVGNWDSNATDDDVLTLNDNNDYDDVMQFLLSHSKAHKAPKHPDPTHKLHRNPKLRQHFVTHNAIATGDLSIIHAKVDGIHRRMTGHSILHSNEGTRRRLQEVHDDQWENSCTRLVKCVRSYTLYDTLVYFIGNYVDDDGVIDDKLVEDDDDGGANLKDIWGKVREVNTILNRFRPVPRRTPGFRGQCNNLLSAFHQNQKFDNFTQYHGGTWREVCRNEGTTKYIKFGEIRNKLGRDIADQVFEDLARCSTKLGEDLFFSSTGAPRLPTKVSDHSRAIDSHGKAKLPARSTTYFVMESLSVMQSVEVKASLANVFLGRGFPRTKFVFRPHYRMWSTAQRGYKAGSTTGGTKCIDRVDQYYKDILISANPNVFKTKKRTYPDLSIECRIAGRDLICDVHAGRRKLCDGAKFVRPRICPADSYSIMAGHFCDDKVTYQVHSLFRAASDRDTAVTLALGEKASVGLVCSFAESTQQVAGYCCLDAPYERAGDSWGNEFTCELGESRCRNKAPTLAGFSEESCNVYSGTWCAYPRDCSPLMTCIADEIAWSVEKNKGAYGEYLTDAPEITDSSDHDQCGALREYLGYDADFPDDEELCEDVQLLRFNRGFDDIDCNFSGGSSGAIGEDADLADADDAEIAGGEDLSDGGETTPLEDPEDPDTSSEAFNKLSLAIYQWDQTLGSLEEAFDVIGGFECPEDFTGAVKTACAAVKNVALIIATVAFFVCKRVYTAIVNSYPEMDSYQQFEVYQHALKAIDNMRILNAGVSQLKAQNLENSGVIISANGINTRSIIEASTQNAQAILDATSDVSKMILEAIEETCATAPTSRNRALLLSNVAECSGADRAVRCGFNSPHASAEGKTLFVEEGEGKSKINTGLFYDIQDSCPGVFDVKVSVTSNELEENPTALLATQRDENDTDKPVVFVSPAKCHDGSAEFCYSDSVDHRFYEISISISGSDGQSVKDTCRVITMPKAANEARELRGQAVRGLSPSEEEALVKSTPTRFVVAELSLTAKVRKN